MLVIIDKHGSINLPAAVRKQMGLVPGTYVDLTILDGGRLALSPVTVYPLVCLSEEGLAKLDEARQSGVDQLPEWLRKEMKGGDAQP
jgi:AbrB family looped-hinge helix DNA binding protein